MAVPRDCRKLTGSPDRKAQKNALRNNVLTAFVSDAMQYVLSSGVHCTHHAISLVWWMARLSSQPTQHRAKLASMRVSMEQLNRLTNQSSPWMQPEHCPEHASEKTACWPGGAGAPASPCCQARQRWHPCLRLAWPPAPPAPDAGRRRSPWPASKQALS